MRKIERGERKERWRVRKRGLKNEMRMKRE